MGQTHKHENWQITLLADGTFFCLRCDSPVALHDDDLHVAVANPDDPMGPPAYGGPASYAGHVLAPGRYDAHWHVSAGAQGQGTLVVNDDSTSRFTRTTKPAPPLPVEREQGVCLVNGEHIITMRHSASECLAPSHKDQPAAEAPLKLMVCTRCNAEPPTERASYPWAVWEWTPTTMHTDDGILYVSPHTRDCITLNRCITEKG